MKNGGLIEADASRQSVRASAIYSAVKNGGLIEADASRQSVRASAIYSAVKNGGLIEAGPEARPSGCPDGLFRREERRPH